MSFISGRKQLIVVMSNGLIIIYDYQRSSIVAGSATYFDHLPENLSVSPDGNFLFMLCLARPSQHTLHNFPLWRCDSVVPGDSVLPNALINGIFDH